MDPMLYVRRKQLLLQNARRRRRSLEHATQAIRATEVYPLKLTSRQTKLTSTMNTHMPITAEIRRPNLLPCPFCDHRADYARGNSPAVIWAECGGCGATGKVCEVPAAAAAIWNTRHEPAAHPDARTQRLEAALVRLRDCDWVISRGDRMDAVREIAREALAPNVIRATSLDLMDTVRDIAREALAGADGGAN